MAPAHQFFTLAEAPPTTFETKRLVRLPYPAKTSHARSVTKSNRMLVLILLLVMAGGAAWPQSTTAPAVQPQNDEDFRVYTDAPRIFLNARRLRLLRRERERESMRWQQFQLLMSGKASMPEPGLANALCYQITGDTAYAKLAIEWALGPTTDLRQQAMVSDWCGSAMTPADATAIASRLERGIERSARRLDVTAVSTRVLAALALADRKPELTEKILHTAVVEWWRGYVVPSIQRGEPVIHRDDILPLFEFLHAVRDSINIELREPIPHFFRDLPSYLLLTYYPAPFPAPENEYHIPVYYENADPDLHRAALSRAAEFSMVAYDANALESQFLQGWLMQDRYLMKSPLGAPYEMLWANPYQPGLSYFHLPMIFRDENRRGGGLAMRSSWEDDALLFTYLDGKAQVFEDGKRKTVDLKNLDKPVRIADAAITSLTRFTAELPVYFVVGLTPGAVYDVEVDDEEMREQRADAGGVLLLKFPSGGSTEVRIHPSGRGHT